MPGPTGAELSNDLELLLGLPRSALTRLSGSEVSPTQASAVQLLGTFSPESTLDQSQQLVKAYIHDMSDVLAMDTTDSERLGARIDSLRERGEALRDSLHGVRV